MTVAITVFSITILLMIASVLFFPKIRLGIFNVDTYWIITFIGAVVMLCCGAADFKTVGQSLIADSSINPLKILVLFISMTILSVFLDELGFFAYLANVALGKSGKNQLALFLYLYITVSVLTVFTSNDIIILSFTPFICCFAKNAKISPMPYLAAEFVAANTWSMALIIGNPTNIYLSAAYGMNFAEYLKISILPTIAAGVVALAVLLSLFGRKLAQPISGKPEKVTIADKPLLIIGVVHLAACTVLLAVAQYIDIEMWIVSACAAISLFVCAIIAAAVRSKKPTALIGCLKRAPYPLIPFLLSMFVMIIALNEQGVTKEIGKALSGELPVLKYGVLSFLTCNIINNIPMSVLFSSVIAASGSGLPAMFATVIGSNIGAFLTPIGALAGIMWSSILNKHGIKFGYRDFLKMGIVCSVPTLIAALGVFRLELLII